MGKLLDHIDGIEITDTQAQQYHNELSALSMLAQGLFFLAKNLKKFEDIVNARIDPVFRENGEMFGISWGANNPDFDGIPTVLISSWFNWYSISACSYAEIIGGLVYGYDSKDKTEYVARILPETKIWRDKVGAHFSFVKIRNFDNSADREVSKIWHPAFSEGRFFIGSLELLIGTENSPDRSRPMRWSLTQVHEGLISRYWPGNSL